jgi:hypothetical protein
MPRSPQPIAELRKIEAARQRLDRARDDLELAIRAAAKAGASLRAMADVSGFGVEWTRRIARKRDAA